MPVVGVGVDLVDSVRVDRLISRNEDLFRSRILGESERLEISQDASKHRRVLAYSGSIAAKEAFLKALGTGLAKGMRWRDVEVIQGCGPTPRLLVSGGVAKALASVEADSIQVSLSSIQSQVLAIVVLTRSETEETFL